MSNILSPGAKPHITADDSPLSGGVLRFYEAGTLIPLTVYSDRELSTSLGSFVALDSDGRATTPVFVAEGVPFKLRIETSGGSLVSETDDQIALASSNQVQGLDAARQLIGYIPTVDPASPAVGDGMADDSVALAAAINGTTQAVIDLGGKTYKINSTVSFTRSDITIRNGTIDMSGLTGASDMDALSFAGSEGSDVAFTGSALPGLSTLTVTSTAGFSAGDAVYAYSSADFVSGCKLGELHRVMSIIDATTIVLCRPLAFDFTGTGGLRKITALSNILIEDVTFIGSVPADVSHFRKAIAFSRCRNVVLRRCRFDGPYSHGVEFSRCYYARVQDCVFRDIKKADSGHAVSIIGGNYDIRVSRSSSENTRHLIVSGWETEGLNQSIHLYGGNHSGIADIALYDTNTYDCSIDQSLTEYSAGNGITVKGDAVKITNSTIRGSVARGISFGPSRAVGSAGASCLLSGNSIEGAGSDGILIQTQSSGPSIKSAIINGNTLDGLSNSFGGIVVNSSVSAKDINGVVIRGNSSVNSGTATHIKLSASASGATLQHVSCAGNTIAGGAVGVEVSCASGATIENLDLDNQIPSSTAGMSISNSGTARNICINGSIGSPMTVSNAASCTLSGLCLDVISRRITISNAGILTGLVCRGSIVGTVLLTLTGGETVSPVIDASISASDCVKVVVSGSAVLSGGRVSGALDATAIGVDLDHNGTVPARGFVVDANIRSDFYGVRVDALSSNWDDIRIAGSIIVSATTSLTAGIITSGAGGIFGRVSATIRGGEYCINTTLAHQLIALGCDLLDYGSLKWNVAPIIASIGDTNYP